MDALGDFYTLLGVPLTAPHDEIRKAYRAAASRFHPDVNDTPAASLIFREITTAYETLSDPDRRSEYDQLYAHLNDGQSNLDLSVQLSRRTLPNLNEPQLVYAMVTLSPPPSRITAGSGTPLNLALVIDRSTSMTGPRLDRVKAATNHIIDELENEDIISIVAFSDHAEVFIQASHPTDRRTMRAIVSTMRASGATAMHEGLVGGMARDATRGEKHVLAMFDCIVEGCDFSRGTEAGGSDQETREIIHRQYAGRALSVAFIKPYPDGGGHELTGVKKSGNYCVRGFFRQWYLPGYGAFAPVPGRDCIICRPQSRNGAASGSPINTPWPGQATLFQ